MPKEWHSILPVAASQDLQGMAGTAAAPSSPKAMSPRGRERISPWITHISHVSPQTTIGPCVQVLPCLPLPSGMLGPKTQSRR